MPFFPVSVSAGGLTYGTSPLDEQDTEHHVHH